MSWWEDDPRYGKAGWTLIHPSGGGRPYFVKEQPRKRRATPRALRFGDLKPGAVLIHRIRCRSEVYVAPHIPGTANDNWRTETVTAYGAAIVRHRWFDPVAGEDDPLRGEMASVQRVWVNGLQTGLTGHTLRGLASQGYHYATPEQAAAIHAFCEAQAETLRAYEAKEINAAEARVRWKPWAAFLRETGLSET